MLACESDGAEAVEALLRAGADPQLSDALAHDAAHYSVTTGNQRITQLLQNGAPATGSDEEERQPPPPPPLPGGNTPRKRKAPPPPGSSPQGCSPSPAPRSPPPPASPEPQTQSPSPSAQSPEAKRSAQANLTEDEEVFEEIRRLRLERGRLLQKIKGLEQQNSANTAAEELTLLKERLEQAEAERDRLRTELEELRACQVVGTSDSDDDMLDFMGAEKLLSRRSRECPSDPDEADTDLADPASAEAADPGTVAELRRQVEDLTSQNQELVLKVQMLEMFEKDDTDMQTSGPDFVPVALYDSLRREFDALQERYSQAQGSAETPSMAGEECEETVEVGEGESGTEGTEGESSEVLRERVRGLEEQLAHSQSELEELREQVHLGVYSVEEAGGGAVTHTGSSEGASQETQQLRERVRELEEALKEGQRQGEESAGDSDTVKQLRKKVEELQAAPEEKESGEKEDGGESEPARSLREKVRELEAALAESKDRVEVKPDGEVVGRLQERVRELEQELRDCVPRSELEEVQVTLGLQCEQLARERAEASLRLNEALLELERLRPPSPQPQGDEEEEEEEEERSEGSEPSITSERSLRRVREELEVARQEAAQALDCLCAEREGRAQDTLRLKDAVPLSQHMEELSALSEQLAQTAQELQSERALRCHAQTEAARLEARLQATEQDLIPREEHDRVKAELQRSLEASESSAAEAKEALSDKEAELRELRSQKAVEQGLVSKEDHESQRLSLQAEINTLTAQFNDLTRKHEKTCTEVFQVQREALFNKSERQVAEAQLATVQQQLADLQAQSSHVQELHKNIQDSQGLVKEKDRKITELSKEVFRLKEALGALSPPLGLSSHSSSQSEKAPPVNPGQQMALQNRVAALSKELQDWERRHRQVVAVYRSHLLAAVQGRMDEEVKGLLLQILRMSHKDQGH
uniref:Ankyrin repeat domain 24 n=2 Tax=Esox lucius TaxID=8010 RepID=A0AAY5KA30_ESOLU